MCELERLWMILGKEVIDMKSVVKQFFFQIIVLLLISDVVVGKLFHPFCTSVSSYER